MYFGFWVCNNRKFCLYEEVYFHDCVIQISLFLSEASKTLDLEVPLLKNGFLNDFFFYDCEIRDTID